MLWRTVVLLTSYPNQILNSSQAECNIPRKLLQGVVLGFFPSLTRLIKLISGYLFGLYDERKCCSVTTNSQRTFFMFKLKWPWWGAILQTPKMCAEVQIFFPHKKKDDSAINLQYFKLMELSSVSNVAHKQNEIKGEGTASNIFQERSFFNKSHQLSQ